MTYESEIEIRSENHVTLQVVTKPQTEHETVYRYECVVVFENGEDSVAQIIF